MRHVLHELLWLMRRRRTTLIIHALLWFALTVASWIWLSPFGLVGGFQFLHCMLLTMTGALALEAGEAARASGTSTFWRTRPPRWGSMWFAQVLYLVVTLMGPALLCWTVNGFLLDQTAAQWRANALTPLMLLAGLLVLTALSSLSSGWGGSLSVLFLCGSGIAAGVSLQWLLEEQLNRRDWPEGFHGGFPGPVTDPWRYIFIAAVVPAAGMALLWAARMRWMFSGRVLVAAGVWFILAPPLVWLALRRLGVRELTIMARVPGEVVPADVRGAGFLKLAGVPPWAEVTLSDDIRATWPGLPEGKGHRFGPSLYWFGGYWYRSYSTAWFTPSVGERMREHFPAETRWYSSDFDETRTEGWWLYDWEWDGPLQARLGRIAAGRLIAPGRGFSVPLKAGAAAAQDGTHLRIKEVIPGILNLRVHLELRHTFYSFFDERDPAPHVLVLHLPALPAAIVYSQEGWLSFHAPQYSGDQRELDVTMPDAEQAAGKRWTPEVLRGAELWHFSPGEATPFIAVPEEGIVTLYPEFDAGKDLLNERQGGE